MKFLLKTLPTLALAGLCFAAQAQTAPTHSDKMKSGSMSHKSMMRDGTMMKNGKMMVMKNGKMMPMTEDMTMTDGSMCMKDGTCKTKDGMTMKMKDGDMMAMDGTMMPGDKMMHDGKMGKMKSKM